MPTSGGTGFLSGHNPFVFSTGNPLPTFILQMLIIVITCRIIKLILSPLRQPSVIAEVIAGIILGPTAMGRIPGYMDTIFNKNSLPFLNLMSNFGLVLFLFLVGLELDPQLIGKSIRKSLAISLAGMVVPFGLGAAVSYGLYTIIEPDTNTTPFGTYLLFLGVAMSITAFPVLARILTELNLLTTPVGSITISAAAVDDATSWCLLALVISIINAGSGLNALWVFLMGLAYALFLSLLVRPALIYVCRRSGAFENGPSQAIVLLCLIIVFVSAFVTDAIGIDAIFGGFLAGVIMPHQNGFARHLTEKLEDIVTVLFLPLYFTLSGLKTQLGTLDDGVAWGMVILVILVACVGKISGCTIAAKLSKMSWRESFTIGIMMNCKGLVELIVLNLGLDAGVISQKTFSIMVIMALVTTFLTVPLLTLVYPKSYYIKKETTPEMAVSSRKVVVCLNKLEHVPALMSIVQLLPIEQLELTALRLIELTDRTSTIMLQANSTETMRLDPVVNVFHTFVQMAASSLNTLMRVVLPKDFASTITNISEEVGSELVVVPWSGSGSLVDNVNATPLESIFPRTSTENTSTSVQHASFIRELFQKAPCRVAVLVDRGLGDGKLHSADSSSMTRNIFMPFFGGKDDRAALELLMDLGSTLINIHILRFTGQDSKPESSHQHQESHLMQPSGEDILKSQTEDELALERHFGTKRNSSTTSLPQHITYTEVSPDQPMDSAIEAISSFTRRDLVVVGRGKLGSLNNLYGASGKRPDNDRRRALGDVAESILLSSTLASVLVVQEKTL